jgi:hypothetical protein
LNSSGVVAGRNIGMMGSKKWSLARWECINAKCQNPNVK